MKPGMGDLIFHVRVSSAYHRRMWDIQVSAAAWVPAVAAIVWMLAAAFFAGSIIPKDGGSDEKAVFMFAGLTGVLFLLSGMAMFGLMTASTAHYSLDARFQELLMGMLSSRFDHARLEDWAARKKLIDEREKRIRRAVHALAYNEVVRELVDVPAEDKRHVRVRWWHLAFGLFTNMFDGGLTLDGKVYSPSNPAA